MLPTVWTIGHSTRPIEEFIAVLEAHRIALLVDVRRFPGSRRLPQFGSEALESALAAAGIDYRWIATLGGRRRSGPASAASAWRNAAFGAYAEHVETEDFADGLTELLMLAHGAHTAIMCAEVLWWRCHRRIVSDVLVSLGAPVMHIRTEREAEPHRLAPPARLVRGRLTYAAEPGADDTQARSNE